MYLLVGGVSLNLSVGYMVKQGPEDGVKDSIFSPGTTSRPSPNIYLTTKLAIIAYTNSPFLIGREYTALVT